MTHFEEVKNQLTNAVLSNDLTLKLSVIGMTREAGFFTGFSSEEQHVLRFLSGDVFTSYLELQVIQTQPA